MFRATKMGQVATFDIIVKALFHTLDSNTNSAVANVQIAAVRYLRNNFLLLFQGIPVLGVFTHS